MTNLPRRLYETVNVITRTVQAGRQLPFSQAFDVCNNRDRLATDPTDFYEIHLDGRPLRTQAGRSFILPSYALAAAIAQEWRAQKEIVDRGKMRLTGLAFTAIDNPLNETKPSITSKILEYLESDTLLYFANKEETGGARLLDLQQKRWAPVIRWINAKHKVDLLATQHITDSPSVPEESRRKLERYLLAHNFASLNALMYGAESVKSFLTVLATSGQHLTIDEAVELARLEQTFQTNTWGNVEWCHDIEELELKSRLAAAILFTNMCSNIHEFDSPSEKVAHVSDRHV